MKIHPNGGSLPEARVGREARSSFHPGEVAQRNAVPWLPLVAVIDYGHEQEPNLLPEQTPGRLGRNANQFGVLR